MLVTVLHSTAKNPILLLYRHNTTQPTSQEDKMIIPLTHSSFRTKFGSRGTFNLGYAQNYLYPEITLLVFKVPPVSNSAVLLQTNMMAHRIVIAMSAWLLCSYPSEVLYCKHWAFSCAVTRVLLCNPVSGVDMKNAPK